jgi:integrase
LIAAKVDPLAISRRLGHASVSFTLEQYGHLFENADDDAADAAADLLDKSVRVAHDSAGVTDAIEP